MKDVVIGGIDSFDRTPQDASFHSVSFVRDPEYHEPGLIIVGLRRYGEYQNICLALADAERFAKELLAEVERRRAMEA